MISTKGAHQSAKFQTSDYVQVKFDQIYTLRGSLYKISAKKYRGVMYDDTEEWCEIWRRTNLLFQKRKEFGEFWSEHSKVSKICTLIGPFCAKYIKFDLKECRREYSEEPCNIWRKADLWFGKGHEEFGKFSSEHLKVSKLVLSWDPFVQSRKWMS